MCIRDRHCGYGYIVTIGCGMQYLGLLAFNELGNGFVNDKKVDIAVMGIPLRSVMTCSTSVSYTHLDVYKRQPLQLTPTSGKI